MSNINTVAISGNLTRDPELRHTAGGMAVCKLRVASNRSKKDPNGDGYIEEATYVDATVFSGFGELVAAKVRKGDAVSVTGRLSSSEWEAQDGTKRSKVEIIVDQLDSQAMFKSKDDVAPLAESTTGAGTQQTTAASPDAPAADDDIPF